MRKLLPPAALALAALWPAATQAAAPGLVTELRATPQEAGLGDAVVIEGRTHAPSGSLPAGAVLGEGWGLLVERDGVPLFWLPLRSAGSDYRSASFRAELRPFRLATYVTPGWKGGFTARGPLPGPRLQHLKDLVPPARAPIRLAAPPYWTAGWEKPRVEDKGQFMKGYYYEGQAAVSMRPGVSLERAEEAVRLLGFRILDLEDPRTVVLAVPPSMTMEEAVSRLSTLREAQHYGPHYIPGP